MNWNIVWSKGTGQGSTLMVVDNGAECLVYEEMAGAATYLTTKPSRPAAIDWAREVIRLAKMGVSLETALAVVADPRYVPNQAETAADWTETSAKAKGAGRPRYHQAIPFSGSRSNIHT
jgi:hypothetical protein